MVSHLPHGGNPTDRQRLLPSGTALSLALSVTGTQPGTEAVQFAPRLVNKGADTVFVTHGSNGFYVRIYQKGQEVYGPQGFPADGINHALAPGESYFFNRSSSDSRRASATIGIEPSAFQVDASEECFAAIAFFEFAFSRAQFKKQGLGEDAVHETLLQTYSLQSEPVHFCIE